MPRRQAFDRSVPAVSAPARGGRRPWAAIVRGGLHDARRGLAGAVAALALAAVPGAAGAAGTLRIAMTAADIPLPNGQTDQGAEGMRFMGLTVFEALVAFDLWSADQPWA